MLSMLMSWKTPPEPPQMFSPRVVTPLKVARFTTGADPEPTERPSPKRQSVWKAFWPASLMIRSSNTGVAPNRSMPTRSGASMVRLWKRASPPNIVMPYTESNSVRLSTLEPRPNDEALNWMPSWSSEPAASKTTGQVAVPWTVKRPSITNRTPAPSWTVVQAAMTNSSLTATVVVLDSNTVPLHVVWARPLVACSAVMGERSDGPGRAIGKAREVNITATKTMLRRIEGNRCIVVEPLTLPVQPCPPM